MRLDRVVMPLGVVAIIPYGRISRKIVASSILDVVFRRFSNNTKEIFENIKCTGLTKTINSDRKLPEYLITTGYLESGRLRYYRGVQSAKFRSHSYNDIPSTCRIQEKRWNDHTILHREMGPTIINSRLVAWYLYGEMKAEIYYPDLKSILFINELFLKKDWANLEFYKKMTVDETNKLYNDGIGEITPRLVSKIDVLTKQQYLNFKKKAKIDFTRILKLEAKKRKSQR